MRRSNLITGCIATVALIVVGAMALKHKRDLRLIDRFRADEAMVHMIERAIAARGQGGIIVFGDSIVARAPLPLEACGVPLVNAGIEGARAGTLIPLLETMAAMLVHPRRIIIAVGVNDSAIQFWHEASFPATYEALVRLATSIAPTTIATVTPIDTTGSVGIAFSDRDRDHVNETIVATASKLSLEVIRLDDLPWHTSDGIHAELSSYPGWVSRVMSPKCD
jgi:hypothetical protein